MSTPTADYDVTYLYENPTTTGSGGRLQRITDSQGLPSYGVEYSWVADSNVVSKHEFKTGSSTVVASANYTYDPDRDLVP